MSITDQKIFTLSKSTATLLDPAGEAAMNERHVCKHDLDASLLSLRIPKTVLMLMFARNRQFTTDELHTVFPFVSLSAVCDTATAQLQYREMCAR
jgi:hypothetical protein